MAKWLECRTPNYKIVSSSPTKLKPLGWSNPFRVGHGWRQLCLSSLSLKWVPGNRQRWQLYLDYAWLLEACKRVYSPRGVEQVVDVTSLPGVMICKALWAGFGKKKCYFERSFCRIPQRTLSVIWRQGKALRNHTGNFKINLWAQCFFYLVCILYDLLSLSYFDFTLTLCHKIKSQTKSNFYASRN